VVWEALISRMVSPMTANAAGVLGYAPSHLDSMNGMDWAWWKSPVPPVNCYDTPVAVQERGDGTQIGDQMVVRRPDYLRKAKSVSKGWVLKENGNGNHRCLERCLTKPQPV
jgi:hypothetical protein